MINKLLYFLHLWRRESRLWRKEREIRKIQRDTDRIIRQFELYIASLAHDDPVTFATKFKNALIQEEIQMQLILRRYHRILPPYFPLAEAAQGMNATEEETLEFLAPFIERGEMKLEEEADGKQYLVNRLSEDY